MKARSSRLGVGYQELQYIELGASSTGYINPNYTCTSNNIDVEIVISTTQTGREMCLIGMGSALEVGYSSTSGRLIAYSSGLTTLAYTGKTNMYDGQPHTFHFWQDSNRCFQVDDFEVLSNATKTTTTNKKIYLLTYDNGNTSYTLQSGKFFRAIIKDNGTTVRYLVPAQRLSDNVAGVYDLINDTFYSSANSSAFIAGSVKPQYCHTKLMKTNIVLPSAYQHIEFLQSTGTQRIKTNLTPLSTYKIEEEFAITNRTPTSCIWCARGATTGTNSLTAFNIANSQVRCDYGVNASMINIGTINANQKYKLTMNANKWYLDDVLKTTMTAATFTAGGPLSLFYSYYNGQDQNVGNYAYMKLYSFKVWDADGKMLMFMVPCKRISDSVGGLYDIIGRQFYTNNGTGTFTLGNDITDHIQCSPKIPKDISLMPNYKRATYLSNSNGAQFLEVNYIPNYTHNIRVEADVQPTALSKRYCLLSTYNMGNAQLSLEITAANEVRLWLNGGNLDQKLSGITTNINHIVYAYDYTNSTYRIECNSAVKTGAYSNTNITAQPNYKMYMFLDRAKRTTTFPTPFRIYNCKIYENDILIHHYVPAYTNNAAATMGMYDLITGEFYSNDGTGSFTKGTDLTYTII